MAEQQPTFEPKAKHVSLKQDPREDTTKQGFYIAFDDNQPKRPKPPLRSKRSPKKEKSLDQEEQNNHQTQVKRESLSQLHNNSQSVNELTGGGGGGDGCGSPATTLAKHNISHFNNTSIGSGDGNNLSFDKSTYNKYTDAPPIQLRNVSQVSENGPFDRRHLEDLTNQQQQQSLQQQQPLSPTQLQRQQISAAQSAEAKSKALVIGTDKATLDPVSNRTELA